MKKLRLRLRSAKIRLHSRIILALSWRTRWHYEQVMKLQTQAQVEMNIANMNALKLLETDPVKLENIEKLIKMSQNG